MKNLIALAMILLILVGCSEEIPDPEKTTPCSTPATVRDLRGLDGCGFVFELSDGTRLQPVQIFYCGTPPLPKEVTADPLYNFDLVDGKQVLISYTLADGASICIAGTLVRITCISEVAGDFPEL